jgi:addiction module RelE/StbE family toxin
VVIWTPLAQADLKNIHDHIAQEAPINAKKVAADLVTQTNTSLSLQQDIGKKVPEFNRDDLREIHIHSWRVIYHIQTNRKFVLTLFHKRRDLTSGDILLPQ